ncbi:hypothetical protein [Pseudomonas chlororaphis]|uniref:hypothetical protein n=1 Tax=Pseudomonas chlororaphis TaxID=587753 RepID=UPI002D76576A|nr:hypothetical protein [Pseudomonas chlororaphis]
MELACGDDATPDRVHPANRRSHFHGIAFSQDGQPLPIRGSNSPNQYRWAQVEPWARLDLLTQMLDERYRRIGVNHAQNLLLMNAWPVQ